MPELPEVETVVRDLKAHAMEHAVISDVEIRWPRIVVGIRPDRFIRALRGRAISRLSRRGKHIVAHLDTGARLIIHLRMTGKLLFSEPKAVPGKHDHVVITFADGRRLFFNDTRKFGRFTLATDAIDPLEALGPEPLEKAFTPRLLRERLADTTRQIKPLLLDQTCVAGLGNIYVDESLWHARIHPERKTNTLTRAEINRLHAAIREVLSVAIENRGTTLGQGATNYYSVAGRRGRNADALQVFRRDGEPCPRCGTTIKRIVVGQRGTHFCPVCQQKTGDKGS